MVAVWNCACALVALVANGNAWWKWRGILVSNRSSFRHSCAYRAGFAAIYAVLYGLQGIGALDFNGRAHIAQSVGVAAWPLVWIFPALRRPPPGVEALERAIGDRLDRGQD